jgi:hypothetical protein
VGVLHRRQTSADVEKLTYPGLTGQETHDADEKLSALLGYGDDGRVHLGVGVTGGTVRIVIVLAA